MRTTLSINKSSIVHNLFNFWINHLAIHPTFDHQFWSPKSVMWLSLGTHLIGFDHLCSLYAYGSVFCAHLDTFFFLYLSTSHMFPSFSLLFVLKLPRSITLHIFIFKVFLNFPIFFIPRTPGWWLFRLNWMNSHLQNVVSGM